MGSQGPKSSKLTRSITTPSSISSPKTPSSSSLPPSSSLSSHLAMVELKQRIINSLSKLSDRDTHQIAVEELENIITSMKIDAVPMLLNCLLDSSTQDPKPVVKKESIRFIAVVCETHSDSVSTHLVKIINHIVKRLRDNDTSVREACREAIGSISRVFIKGDGDNGVVSLFVRPLFEAMCENNKGVQIGASMCLGRVIECVENTPVSVFQKICPRVCKYLNSPNFFAKSALLPVIGSLSQVGAIAPQSLDPLMQCIHDCLGSTDWATRKAAAETLTALALHSSDLVKDRATSTLTILESCRFDKIKPVRDSMNEALQIWKKIGGKAGDGAVDETEDGESNLADKDKQKDKKPAPSNAVSSPKDSSNSSACVSDSTDKTKSGNISDKAVGMLKKKLPLTDKDLNPEFFQKLEKRRSDDCPVEVVVPRKCQNQSASNEGEAELSAAETKDMPNKGSVNVLSRQRDAGGYVRDNLVGDGLSGKDMKTRTCGIDYRGATFPKPDGQLDGSLMTSKGNWLAIQRQLLHLERQQAHLMNMLQEFMGGSHDSMVTLENRVRGLERVVEDMAHDLSISSGRRGGSFRAGYDGSSNRSGRYNSYLEYGGRLPFGDRYSSSEGVSPIMRGRGAHWRSDHQEPWDFHSYGTSKNGPVRRDVGTSSLDGRSPRSDHENDQVSARRAWDKGTGSVRLGEGPSARSVWQASKDEATLAAIRVAGDDNGTSRAPRGAVRELEAEAMGNDNNVPERDPIWTSWSNAMDAFQVGDIDTAYAEVLSTGDDSLLVKLMDRSGPIFDQLSNEVAVDLLNAMMPFVVEQNLFDLCLCWAQQLLELVVENGPDVFGIPIEVKRELLFNLHEASSTLDLPEDWEGTTPDQLLVQLASAWDIDFQQHGS